MRTVSFATLLTFVSALPLGAQETQAEPPKLLTANGGLMFWTFVIFVVVLIVLTKFAFKPITRAVEAREKALEEAIEAAKREREEAAKLLQEHRRLVGQAHADAQTFIAAGRAAGEKIRADIIEEAHREQQRILERARQEIQSERDKAILELYRDIFSGTHDALKAVVLKDLYDLLEKVIDRCRDVGTVISQIVLKNS